MSSCSCWSIQCSGTCKVPTTLRLEPQSSVICFSANLAQYPDPIDTFNSCYTFMRKSNCLFWGFFWGLFCSRFSLSPGLAALFDSNPIIWSIRHSDDSEKTVLPLKDLEVNLEMIPAISPLVFKLLSHPQEAHLWVVPCCAYDQRKLGSNTSVLRTNRFVRLDLDEGRCVTLHYITTHHKRIDLDEGRCVTLHCITTHHKRIDLDEERCVTLHYITIDSWGLRWGGSRSTKTCVFPCQVAAAGDERYLLCAAVAAAVGLPFFAAL